jgi:hypothetical protein
LVVFCAVQAARLGKGQMPETVPLHARQHPIAFADRAPPDIIRLAAASFAAPVEDTASLPEKSWPIFVGLVLRVTPPLALAV